MDDKIEKCQRLGCDENGQLRPFSYTYGTTVESATKLQKYITCDAHKKEIGDILDYMATIVTCARKCINITDIPRLTYAERRISFNSFSALNTAFIELRQMLKPEIVSSDTFQKMNIDHSKVRRMMDNFE